mmetsp:Transcript_39620/g.44362  ORF Transcript_39620/g.44362 Transcript_39620/m.44362 type:complete len:88 (+) Transcript_39620:612-875(+)
MPHEKGEVKVVHFSGSDFGGNNLGFNMDPGRARPEVTREMTRRPTSNAPSNLMEHSLKVVVRRVSLLLYKHDGYTPSVIDIFGRIFI